MKHCIQVSKCRAIVYDLSLEKPLSEIAANLQAPQHQNPFQVLILLFKYISNYLCILLMFYIIQFFCINNDLHEKNVIGGAIHLESVAQPFPVNGIPRKIRKSINWNDHFCYIFTSGTTGNDLYLVT